MPDKKFSTRKQFTIHDAALLDEMSGLTMFVDNFLAQNNIPETTKERIRARYLHYEGDKPKTEAINEMRLALYGASR